MSVKTDKDRPSTWRSYYDGLCNSCDAQCCAMPVEVNLDDLIQLGLANEDDRHGSIKKLAKRLIKEKWLRSYRDSTGLFMLNSRPNGDCCFLDEKTRLCRVYEKRPSVCRLFPKHVGPRIGFCPQRKK